MGRHLRGSDSVSEGKQTLLGNVRILQKLTFDIQGATLDCYQLTNVPRRQWVVLTEQDAVDNIVYSVIVRRLSLSCKQ